MMEGSRSCRGWTAISDPRLFGVEFSIPQRRRDCMIQLLGASVDVETLVLPRDESERTKEDTLDTATKSRDEREKFSRYLEEGSVITVSI